MVILNKEQNVEVSREIPCEWTRGILHGLLRVTLWVDSHVLQIFKPHLHLRNETCFSNTQGTENWKMIFIFVYLLPFTGYLQLKIDVKSSMQISKVYCSKTSLIFHVEFHVDIFTLGHFSIYYYYTILYYIVFLAELNELKILFDRSLSEKNYFY